MKIKLLSFVIRYSLFVIPLIGFSQCPNASITLSSQAEVDAFATNYPGCTELQNTLTISGTDITDLTPLSNIIYIPSLRIMDNPLLTQLTGLHNLESAVPNSTSLYLSNNPLLTNLSVFSGLTFLDGLSVIGCSSLTSLEGLNSVTNYEANYSAFLVIDDNALLQDISALSNISNFENPFSLFSLQIRNNPVLTSLNGLQGFNGDYEYLNITNNNSLVDLTGLSNNFGVYEICYIEDNDSLQSFNGLVDFWAHELNIVDNPILNDLSALDNYSGYPPALVITGNTSLAICNNATFCGSITEINECCGGIHPNFLIENNLPGCNSILEISNSCGLEPINDECEGAIELTLGETITAYNELATASTQSPSCNDEDRADVWFMANSGAYTSLDIIAEAGYNLQLWEGDCGSLTPVANACAEGSLNDISVTTNTNYYIQVWSCETCRMVTGLFDILVQDGTLSNEAFVFDDFHLFPNPVKDALNLSAKSNIESVAIYNLLGQEVMRAKPNTIQTSINTTGLKAGIYLVKVGIGSQEMTYKVVKK